jgi:hypothetical protein
VGVANLVGRPGGILFILAYRVLPSAGFSRGLVLVGPLRPFLGAPA